MIEKGNVLGFLFKTIQHVDDWTMLKAIATNYHESSHNTMPCLDKTYVTVALLITVYPKQ